MRLPIVIGLLIIMAIQAVRAEENVKDKLMILDQVEETLQARVDLIRNAKKTIDIQYFSIESDEISVAGLALVKDAARRGVDIRVIVDSLNNKMTRELMSAFLDNLSTAEMDHIQIREFNQFSLLHPFCYTRRMHDKAMIIDNEYLIVGDRNVGDGYYNGDIVKQKTQLVTDLRAQQGLPIYQGIDAIIYGPTAPRQAAEYFNARWNSTEVKPVHLYDFQRNTLDLSYCHLKSGEGADPSCFTKLADNIKAVKYQMHKLDLSLKNANRQQTVSFDNSLSWFSEAADVDSIKYIHDDVGEKNVCDGKPANNIGAQLYKAIDDFTQHDLTIVTPYLVITSEMEALVKKLISRGVHVKFITNSKLSSDVAGAVVGYEKTRNKILDLGVVIYEYERLDSEVSTIHTLHAKVVLMDTVRATDNSKIFIGSYNWDPRSQNLNSEVGILATVTGKHTRVTKQLRDRIAEILKNTSTLTRRSGTKKELILTLPVDQNNATIKTMINQREKSVQLWEKILNLAPSLEEQL